MKLFNYILVLVFGIQLVSCTYSGNYEFQKSKNSIKNLKNQFSNSLLGKSKIQFVKDSLIDIKENTNKIQFVEITKFTDTLSIRYLTSNNKVTSYLYKEKNKNSKHISTTYITSKNNKNYVNSEMKNLISLLQNSMINEENGNKNEGFLDFLITQHRENCNLLQFETAKSENRNTFLSSYDFDNSGQFDVSIHTINYLLQNFSVDKFIKLWDNDLCDFEKFYKKPFLEIENDIHNQLAFNDEKIYTNEWLEFIESCN